MSARKPIVCPCAECRGREWPIDELRAHPQFPEGNPPVNGFTLKKIAAALDHPLRYADAPVAGEWSTPPAPVPPRRADGPRERWRYATDPEAMEDVRFFPVNGSRIQPNDGPQEGT